MFKSNIFLVFIIIIALAACSGGKSKSNSGNSTKKSATTDLAGETVYKTYCLACHQTDGSGVPGTYPPLKKSDVVNGDKDHLIHILLEGLSGEVVVNGTTFNSIMPSQSYLTDQQIADVLTYVRSDFGNTSGAVTPDEVTSIRGQKK